MNFELLISQQDNLSRGNLGAVKVLQGLFPQTGRLQFIYADLGDPAAVWFYNLKLIEVFFFFWVLNKYNFRSRKSSQRMPLTL